MKKDSRNTALSAKTIAKYNIPRCDFLEYTEEGLREYQRITQQQPGLPRFLRELLKGTTPLQKTDLLDTHPELFVTTENKSFLINPICQKDYEAFKSQYENKDLESLRIIAWALHPSFRDREILDEEKRGEVIAKLKEKNDGSARYYPNQDRRTSNSFIRERTDSQLVETIEDMQKESGRPYLATLLDLTRDDVAALKELKALAAKHLKEQYNVSDKDDVKMFFHFPYAEETVTLHMHIRVNDPNHQLDEGKSFSVDDVIKSLEEHGSVVPLLMSRKCKNPEGKEVSGFYLNPYTPLLNVEGFRQYEAVNPYYKKDLAIPIPPGTVVLQKQSALDYKGVTRS